MADLQVDDVFDKLLDRLVDVVGAADRERVKTINAEGETALARVKMEYAQTAQRDAEARATKLEADETKLEELWTAAGALLTKIGIVMGDSGIVAPGLAAERDRLAKAVAATKSRLDPIPF